MAKLSRDVSKIVKEVGYFCSAVLYMYSKKTKMVKKHETKMIVENGLAIAILFINLLVTYVVQQPVKSYDYINCKFY